MAYLRNDGRYTRVAIDRHLHQCSLHFKIEDAPYVTYSREIFLKAAISTF
jgi:hypothetical protein